MRRTAGSDSPATNGLRTPRTDQPDLTSRRHPGWTPDHLTGSDSPATNGPRPVPTPDPDPRPPTEGQSVAASTGGSFKQAGHLIPELAEGQGGRGLAGEHDQRLAAHGHLLHRTGRRDRDRADQRILLRQIGQDLGVQLAPPIEHREVAAQLRLAALQLGGERGQLLERPHRQHRRNERHQHHVGGAQHVLRHQRQTRRGVQDDHVELRGQRRQQPTQCPLRVRSIVEVDVHVPVREVRRQQVQVCEVGGLDRLQHRARSPDQLGTAALDARLHPEQVRGGALGIEIPEQGPAALPRRQVGEVDGRGGLAHPTLEVVARDHLHDGTSVAEQITP